MGGSCRRWPRLLAVAGLCLTLWGCALTPRDPFTAGDQGAAIVGDTATLRSWGDLPAASLAQALLDPAMRPRAARAVNYLALSGGGAGGAFTAGVLKGWTAAGTRPVFDVVSGVSTGALLAPFAFLGPAYDGWIEHLYTGDAPAALFRPQSLAKMLTGGGLIDPGPLRQLVETYATADLLARIAAEHRRGRRLLVVTTNLDAQRPVVWNMGAIAASGRPDALRLFRQVLIASASIPVVYPPVMIEARSAGRTIAEMHVDGAASGEVFVVPDMLVANGRQLPDAARRRPPPPAAARRNIHLWVVINNTLGPEFAITSGSTLPMAGRALATLLKAQTLGILAASAEAAARLGMDFNVASIDRAVDYRPDAPFDARYMDAVFAIGETEARAGTLWRKSPRDFGPVAER